MHRMSYYGEKTTGVCESEMSFPTRMLQLTQTIQVVSGNCNIYTFFEDVWG